MLCVNFQDLKVRPVEGPVGPKQAAWKLSQMGMLPYPKTIKTTKRELGRIRIFFCFYFFLLFFVFKVNNLVKICF